MKKWQLSDTIFATLLTASLLATFMVSAGTMSVSEQRIMITDKSKRSEFKVYNTSPEVQSIRVSLIEKAMDENGGVKTIESTTTSAAGYIRIGPRVGKNIAPKDFQTFRLRAKLNQLADGEYRSHLLFESMNPPKDETKPGIHVKPNIRYSIPVIIRKGQLSAEIAIKDAILGENEQKQPTIAFNVTRNGNRSIYGDIDIYQIVAGKEQLIASDKNHAIYTDVKQRKFTITLNEAISDTELKIVFRENPEFGGDQTAETTIKV